MGRDQAGATYASCCTRNESMVTTAFTGIDFKHQVWPSDSVDF